jgi:transcriptional regulator with XRE-family HTH domain
VTVPTLKEARAVRLLTLRALAERADVAVSTVHLIETGKSVPRFGVIQKLSAALGVEPQEVTEFAAAIEEIASGKESAAVPASARAAAG